MAPLRRRHTLPTLLAISALGALPACAPRLANPVPEPVSVRIGRLEFEGLFEEALEPVPQGDRERALRLVQLFERAGCAADQIELTRVAGSRHKNVSCSLPGRTGHTIVVGAHYDHTGYGIGLSDNWSGLAMLPILYRALASAPREHGFVFLGFAAAAKDQSGSESYLRRMRPFQRAELAAMVNLKGLGLGTTAVWSSLADPDLRLDLVSVSKALGVELRHVDLSRRPRRRLRDERSPWPIHADAISFRRYQIPSILIHSYDRNSARLLAQPYREDDRSLFDPEAYAESLRLVSVYLAYLDQTLALRRERGN